MTNTIYFHNTNREEEDSDSVSTTTEESPTTSRRHTTTGEILSSGSVTHTPLREGGKLEISLSKSFSFKELRSATRNFHHNVLLGEGAFGMVFKGWIDENKLVATKPGKGIPVAIRRFCPQSFQGHNELQVITQWQTEVKYLGRLYHPNLVRLLGHCIDKDEQSQHVIVYEFMPRGSLNNHLFKKDSPPLSWSVRMKIALGAAKGLSFLHSTSVNVIHWNFRSSNILLDMNYNAKICGFGLAMDGPTGGKGYIDTFRSGHLTAKNDVSAFGALLLEMLTGMRTNEFNILPYKYSLPYECSLVKWMKSYLEQPETYDVADSRLEGQYSLEGFQKAANLALKCLSIEGMSRPNMDEVVKVLEELQNSKDTEDIQNEPNINPHTHSISAKMLHRRIADEAASHP